MIAQHEVIGLFAGAMERRGHPVVVHEDWMEHRESGIGIYPRALEPVPDPSLVHSVVVVTVDHPRFPPEGIVEFQHAVSDTHRQAILDGVDQWLQIDFPVLLDALRERPETCMVMQWEPPGDGAPELTRRVLFGPTAHFVAQPERLPTDVEHPFCACCLFTNTHEAFRSHIEGDGFFGIRLLATRENDGSTQADCRINGTEWEIGKSALRAYAETWPHAGFEMRKQYVMLQSVVCSAE